MYTNGRQKSTAVSSATTKQTALPAAPRRVLFPYSLLPRIVHPLFARSEENRRERKRDRKDDPPLRRGVAYAVGVKGKGVVYDHHRHGNGFRHRSREQFDLRIRLKRADQSRYNHEKERGAQHGQRYFHKAQRGVRAVELGRLGQILRHALQSREQYQHRRPQAVPDIDGGNRAQHQAGRKKAHALYPQQAQHVIDYVSVLEYHQFPKERGTDYGHDRGQIDHGSEELSPGYFHIEQKREQQCEQRAEKHLCKRIDHGVADGTQKAGIHGEYLFIIAESQKFERPCGQRGYLRRGEAHDQAERHRYNGE